MTETRSNAALRQQQRAADLGRRIISEFIGTFVMTFTFGINNQITSLTWYPFAIGLMLAALTYAFGDVSGAHFNPAVTIGSCIYGSIAAADAAAYIVTQVFAATCGGMAYNQINPHIFRLLPDVGYGNDAVVVVEFTYTFMLVFVFMNMFASQKMRMFRGFAIGLFLIAATYGGGSITGASFNPALTVGVDLVAYQRHWRHNYYEKSTQTLEPFATGWYVGAQVVAAIFGGLIMCVVRPVKGAKPGRVCTPFTNRVLCEFLASFMVVLNTGFNVVVMSRGAALSMGGMYMALALAISDVSGGCINPSVTLGLAITRKWPFNVLPGMEAASYIFAQLAAAAASGMLYTATTDRAFALGPGQGYTISQALGMEAAATTLLTMVAVATTKAEGPVAVAVGLVHIACIVTVGPISGGTLSPAIAVGVTVSAYLKDGLSYKYCLLYVAVHTLAAFFAAELTKMTHPDEKLDTSQGTQTEIDNKMKDDEDERER